MTVTTADLRLFLESTIGSCSLSDAQLSAGINTALAYCTRCEVSGDQLLIDRLTTLRAALICGPMCLSAAQTLAGTNGIKSVSDNGSSISYISPQEIASTLKQYTGQWLGEANDLQDLLQVPIKVLDYNDIY